MKGVSQKMFRAKVANSGFEYTILFAAFLVNICLIQVYVNILI